MSQYFSGEDEVKTNEPVRNKETNSGDIENDASSKEKIKGHQRKRTKEQNVGNHKKTMRRSNSNKKEEPSGDVALLAESKRGLDPYAGKAPIPSERLLRHSRGPFKNMSKGFKGKFNKFDFQRKENKVKFAKIQAARTELLLPEEEGFIEADTDEFTTQYKQSEIKNSVDITSATKHFDLKLEFGSYALNYSRNGRHLLLGGKRGHVAAFDWVTKDLMCEMNVMESVHDVVWLHNETMFAVAQKEWTYMYDNQGIEIHCIKKLDRVLKMEYLPYHFLLATSSEKGFISWLDISIGKMVQQTHTHLGRLDVMCQNPYNAVLCCGHSKGTVTMWTPNMQDPVVKMLCHKQPIRACTVDQRGLYLATAAIDGSLKVWDVRNYKCLQSYRVGAGASHVAFSQKGLLAVSLGNIVEVYKDSCLTKAKYPYLKHQVGSTVSGLQFCPFEDVLGVSHFNGMCSMLVPGCGEPNYDALELNPFQTKSQRREAEVKALLEKIQPELITLDPTHLVEVDKPTLEEKLEAKRKLLYVKPPKIDLRSRKNYSSVKKMRNKQKVQEQANKEFYKNKNEVQKDLLGEESRTQKPKTVLDRFKPKQKKQKTAE